jgi:hypothetical protein
MLTKSSQKVASDFCCEICNYNTSKSGNYNKHLLTAKHISLTDLTPKLAKSSQHHTCSTCNKVYKSRVGLWGHKKKCLQELSNSSVPSPVSLENILTTIDEPTPLGPSINLNVLVIDLLKQNQELQKQLIELSQEKTIVMNNCNNNNTNHFNLQLFLNETCKDALTADQFVENIQITNGDLENVGNQGYVQGITDIIMKQLRTLDVTKRPFHCTDVKRETIYIKDADEWKKDTDEKSKLKNVIEKVATKGRRKVSVWQRSHPEVAVLDSNDYEMNHKILRHTWGDGDTEKLQEKVIKNLAKEVHIDRGNML